MAYRPKPFTVPLRLHVPETVAEAGTRRKAYVPEDGVFLGSFASYGGTESVTDGVLAVTDTARVEAFYDPAIKAGCRIERLDFGGDGAENPLYDVIGEPEDIEQRHLVVRLLVRRVKGGA